MNAAYLYAGLLSADLINDKRHQIWDYYDEHLRPLRDAGFIDVGPFAGGCVDEMGSGHDLVDQLQSGTDERVVADDRARDVRIFADERSFADDHVAVQPDVARAPHVVLQEHRTFH